MKKAYYVSLSCFQRSLTSSCTQKVSSLFNLRPQDQTNTFITVLLFNDTSITITNSGLSVTSLSTSRERKTVLSKQLQRLIEIISSEYRLELRAESTALTLQPNKNVMKHRHNNNNNDNNKLHKCVKPWVLGAGCWLLRSNRQKTTKYTNMPKQFCLLNMYL